MWNDSFLHHAGVVDNVFVLNSSRCRGVVGCVPQSLSPKNLENKKTCSVHRWEDKSFLNSERLPQRWSMRVFTKTFIVFS